jgi:hypothetical protein
MAKAQNTLAAMGWEIGQDESGDDDAGVFVIRAGDENGNSYMAFPHSELDLNEEQGNDFNTYTTNAQGQRLQQSPNLMGVQQTKNLDTGDTTTDYNQGPMSASQTKNAAGATTAKAQSVDLGVAKFGTKQQQPNYAAGQLASPTVAKVSVPAGDATVTQKSYAGPMLGGASGPGVGNNVITKAAQVVPNANPAKSAVDPAAAADATATANQLSQAAAPALNKQQAYKKDRVQWKHSKWLMAHAWNAMAMMNKAMNCAGKATACPVVSKHASMPKWLWTCSVLDENKIKTSVKIT